ncbi:MAG: hypothetical protein UMV23_06240 [Halanaerobium sp.]|nr:hypothetical protein [Halanaerobium sp.]
MRKYAIVSLVIILCLLIVPAAMARNEISVSTDYWMWDGDIEGEPIAGSSYVLSAEFSISSKLSLRYTGVFGEVDSIGGYPLSSFSIEPDTNYLTLHYWFNEYFNVSVGYMDKNITISDGYDSLDLIELRGIRFGIGGEWEVYNKLTVFGELGYVPAAKAYLFGGFLMPVDTSAADFKIGVSYAVTGDFAIRGGYMASYMDIGGIETQVDGIFFGLSYDF